MRFGGEHSSLDERGRSDVAALVLSVTAASVPATGPVLIGPELSVRHSAEILGVTGPVDQGLASLNVGAWSGRTPEDIDPAELGEWFTDPSSSPHGGESVAAFITRIGAHVQQEQPALMVVAKPVAQALLCTGPAEFFATDVRPATLYR